MLLFSTVLLQISIFYHVSASPRETTDIRFLYQCVDQHNELRRAAGLSVMMDYDREIEALSRKRAELMANSSKLLNETHGLLENSAFVPSVNETVGSRDVVNLWFRETHFKKASESPADVRLLTSSKSSAIWSESSRIGCARFMTQKPEPGSYIVCNYGFPSEQNI